MDAKAKGFYDECCTSDVPVVVCVQPWGEHNVIFSLCADCLQKALTTLYEDGLIDYQTTKLYDGGERPPFHLEPEE